MNKKLFNFIIFGCFGIAAEVFFTATVNFIHEIQQNLPHDYRLIGKSYIWMFFIYGAASMLFPPFYRLVSRHHLVVRLFFYGCGIFIVEFISGFLLEKITGVCPWHYTSGVNILGYIRLDYLPVWMFFGWLMERFYLIINKY